MSSDTALRTAGGHAPASCTPHGSHLPHSWVTKWGSGPGSPEPPKSPPEGGLAPRRDAGCVSSPVVTFLPSSESGRHVGQTELRPPTSGSANTHEYDRGTPSAVGEAVSHSPAKPAGRLYRCGEGLRELRVRRACPRSVWPRPASQPVAPIPASPDPTPVHMGPSGATGVRVKAQGNAHLFSLPILGVPAPPRPRRLGLHLGLDTHPGAIGPVRASQPHANVIPLQACALTSVPLASCLKQGEREEA